jgi:hypothetical protein
MSVPLATIFHGDVTLEQGSDVSQFGFGDLCVARKVTIRGEEDSTGSSSVGSLIVDGGVLINKALHVKNDAYVLYGKTNLTQTFIDTTNNLNGYGLTITGGNAVDISVGASSRFASTQGNLSLESLSQSLRLYGGLNSCSAVDIHATNVNGGISLLSGNNGCIDIVSGAMGISASTSNGNVAITANNGSGSFSVNSQTANQNLVLALNGSTDSQVRIQSSGTNVSQTAVVIDATHTNGNIQISNASGLGKGSTTQLVGSGGYVLTTNTGGSISVASQGAPSSYIVQSSEPNNNMTIGVQGSTDSSLILQSSGTNATNTALQIKTTSMSGNIEIKQPNQATGQVNVLTGSAGFRATTQTGGSIVLTAVGAPSTYTNATNSDNQNLTVSVTGNTKSKVIISSSGTGSDAITLETTNSTGGITLTSVGGVQIDSTNSNLGVQIATSIPNIPVKIGTSSSTTTIMGNLDVKGTTTTIESEIVTIEDNIIVVNNAPQGSSDGGIAIKRYQAANDTGSGDVVMDTPEFTGIVGNGSNTTTTINLGFGASSITDYYNGWWVRITSGTGQNQVRRIKSYDGNTKLATIYDTSDQTTLGNPVPVEGMDFITTLDATSTFAMFPCHYVMNIWDESRNEFALVCSGTGPAEQASISHYSNLHINDLDANGIFTNSLNGSMADITFTVALNNGNTTPVAFPSSGPYPYNCFPKTFGVYMVFVQPLTVTSRAHAIFMIGRVDAPGIPGTVVRLISAKGAQYEQLDMQWRANQYPELAYRPNPIGGSGTTIFKVKVISL